MESKSSISFFQLLSHQSLIFPILETGIIRNDRIDILLSNDSQGYIKRKNPKPLEISRYLMQSVEENDLKNRLLKLNNTRIIYAYKKGERKIYDDTSVKDLISKGHQKPSFDMIQKCLPNGEDKIYSARVSYYSNKYQTSFTFGKSLITDQIAISSMIDMITMIMFSIESSEMKRVIQLHLEFLRDGVGALWFMNSTKCFLIEAKNTINEHILEERDLENFILAMAKKAKEKTMMKKIKISKDEVKKRNEDANSYIFKRGQLRNKSSNLESPIRITSPERLDEEEEHRKHSLKSKSQLMLKPKYLLYHLFEKKVASDVDENKPKKKFSVYDVLNNYLEKKRKKRAPTKSLSKISTEPEISQINENLLSDIIKEKTASTSRISQSSLVLPGILRKRQDQNERNTFMEVLFKTYFKEKDPQILEEDEARENTESSQKTYSEFLRKMSSTKKEKGSNHTPRQSNLILKPIFEELQTSKGFTSGTYRSHAEYTSNPMSIAKIVKPPSSCRPKKIVRRDKKKFTIIDKTILSRKGASTSRN